MHRFLRMLLSGLVSLFSSLKVVKGRQIVLTLNKVAFGISNALLESPGVFGQGLEKLVSFLNRFPQLRIDGIELGIAIIQLFLRVLLQTLPEEKGVAKQSNSNEHQKKTDSLLTLRGNLSGRVDRSPRSSKHVPPQELAEAEHEHHRATDEGQQQPPRIIDREDFLRFQIDRLILNLFAMASILFDPFIELLHFAKIAQQVVSILMAVCRSLSPARRGSPRFRPPIARLLFYR